MEKERERERGRERERERERERVWGGIKGEWQKGRRGTGAR